MSSRCGCEAVSKLDAWHRFQTSGQVLLRCCCRLGTGSPRSPALLTGKWQACSSNSNSAAQQCFLSVAQQRGGPTHCTAVKASAAHLLPISHLSPTAMAPPWLTQKPSFPFSHDVHPPGLVSCRRWMCLVCPQQCMHVMRAMCCALTSLQSMTTGGWGCLRVTRVSSKGHRCICVAVLHLDQLLVMCGATRMPNTTPRPCRYSQVGQGWTPCPRPLCMFRCTAPCYTVGHASCCAVLCRPAGVR